MVVKTENAVTKFIAQTRELFAGEPDPEKRWESMRPVLLELLSDPQVMESSKNWPDCVPQDGRAENLLFYEDPDYNFVINGLTKAANSRYDGVSQVHDHAHIYTLYGVLDGTEYIERYKRTDDGSDPDVAVIEQSANDFVGPGVVDLVRPWEIHAENNKGVRSVAVIIRSEKQGAFLQGRFDPATNKYWQGYGPRQTPTEMLS
ncbi:MAG: putative metal-dependent enzyme of the double-stranded beta helix superfamily [Chloroflexi bacterium]|jgi:predicted metal-dependent enzyme (double-stranded beta helix superfamily)|nr:MAG: putative metal-dependent enzyme of the double-stranded beta helix superfamily [Chloroflexota bacterium]